jgi:hypothetical protein
MCKEKTNYLLNFLLGTGGLSSITFESEICKLFPWLSLPPPNSLSTLLVGDSASFGKKKSLFTIYF